MTPTNAVDPDGGLLGAIRPWLLTPAETILVTADNPEAGHAEVQAATDALAGLPAASRFLEVVYEAGEYPSVWGGFSYTHSETLDPDSVLVSSSATGSGVHHAYSSLGSPTFMEGITLRSLPAADGPKYPLHITGRGSMVWSNCRFESAGSASGGPVCVGLDGGAGLDLHFYRCTFENEGGNAFNIHGATDNPLYSSVNVSLVDCFALGDTSGVVDYEALSVVTRDRIWIAGGNLVRGTLGGSATWGDDDHWRIPVGGMNAATRLALFGANGVPTPTL